ncbi:DegT/DnrJ/EryC1/StrS family aminotransferase [candidate division KSB1 bacterium]|nr:DegT/DnrJ/EryC1/StrS family aminotransferase [candidate division KSB1 bacterium]MBL7095924.1 DegT/DnrJ/EryC1/StrS family aminotransferase [candidate division KSB1 bacterium]
MNKLAIDGGIPVREQMLPIFKLELGENEFQAVRNVLESGSISRGNFREKLEAEFCNYTKAKYAIVLNSGTAALHLAVNALNLEPNDEVIVPSLSFVATAFAAEYSGLKPVFAEIDPATFNISVEDVKQKISDRTRAIIPVHYAGLPVNLDALREISQKHNLFLIEDAAHAIGANHNGTKIGNFGDLTAFSLFATKNMTAGEGGIITTNNKKWADSIRLTRAHGITASLNSPAVSGLCDVSQLGYNFHLSNLNIAVAIEQLKKLDKMNQQRKEMAVYLSNLLKEVEEIELPGAENNHIFHLYTIKLMDKKLAGKRDQILESLLAEGIQVGVYYLPIHLFSYFRNKYGTAPGDLPITETVCNSLVTLPLYPSITKNEIKDIAAAIKKVVYNFSQNKR